MMDAIKFNIVGLCRSYGVILWEITSYGDAPLDDMEAKDIVEAAQDGTLQHSRSVLLFQLHSTVENRLLQLGLKNVLIICTF